MIALYVHAHYIKKREWREPFDHNQVSMDLTPVAPVDFIDLEEVSDWMIGLPPLDASDCSYKLLSSSSGYSYLVVPRSLAFSDCPGARLTEAIAQSLPAYTPLVELTGEGVSSSTSSDVDVDGRDVE